MNDHLPEAMEKLEDLLDGERVGMLTRWTPEGRLQSKPLAMLSQDASGAFWFYVVDHGASTDDELQYRHVNLAFSRSDKGLYVSIAGQGRLVRDRALIRAMWTPMAKPWFPDGPDSAGLALLEILPTHVEYWTGPSNAVSRVLAMAASIATGRPVGMGEHGEMDLTQTRSDVRSDTRPDTEAVADLMPAPPADRTPARPR